MKTRHLPAALIAFAAVTASPASHAAIIYSGVQNVPIPFDLPAGQEGVYLNIATGSTTVSYPADWSTAPWLNPFFGGVDVANSPLLRPVITPIVSASGGYVATHGSPYDYDRRVPILFWRPGVVRNDRPEAVATVDIMPTLAAMLGLPIDASKIDGRCLASARTGACPTR